METSSFLLIMISIFILIGMEFQCFPFGFLFVFRNRNEFYYLVLTSIRNSKIESKACVHNAETVFHIEKKAAWNKTNGFFNDSPWEFSFIVRKVDQNLLNENEAFQRFWG